jgi:hypothetical protein
MTTITSFFTFGSILIAETGGSFESEPSGLSFIDNILESFHESPTAFILFFIMFGICVYGLCSYVYHHFLLWLRSDPNLERIQPIDGPNVSRGERGGKRPPLLVLSANYRMKALMELKKLD